MKYVVTGVDGQLGGRVAQNMIKAVGGHELIFTCPDIQRISTEKKNDWVNRGIAIRQANYDDKEEMIRSFSGGDRLYMISGIKNGPERQKQHKDVIDAAKEAGIKHITYTSFLGANRDEYHQYVLPDHTITEAHLKESGLDYNIMRNNLYLDNYLTDFPKMAFWYDRKWRTTAGETEATFVIKDDSARVATSLLLGKGEYNKDYDVTGGQLLSERRICQLVSEISGVELEYTPMTHDEFFEFFDSIGVPRTTNEDSSKAPFLWCSNDIVTNEASVGDGLMAVETSTIKDLTGREPMKIEDIVQEYAMLWSDWINQGDQKQKGL